MIGNQIGEHIAVLDQAIVQALENRGEICGNERRLRAAVTQHEGVVVARKPCVDGHRDDTGLDGAQEAGVEVRRIVEAEEDAFLAPDVQQGERMCKAVRRRVDVGVAMGAPAVDHRRFRAPPGCEVAPDQIRRRIVTGHCVHASAMAFSYHARAQSAASSSGSTPEEALWRIGSPTRRAPSSLSMRSKVMPPPQKVRA